MYIFFRNKNISYGSIREPEGYRKLGIGSVPVSTIGLQYTWEKKEKKDCF